MHEHEFEAVRVTEPCFWAGYYYNGVTHPKHEVFVRWDYRCACGEVGYGVPA